MHPPRVTETFFAKSIPNVVMCITAPPFFLMMSVGCARNPTHCASYETRVEEGWVHFISAEDGVKFSLISADYLEIKWRNFGIYSNRISTRHHLLRSFVSTIHLLW